MRWIKLDEEQYGRAYIALEQIIRVGFAFDDNRIVADVYVAGGDKVEYAGLVTDPDAIRQLQREVGDSGENVPPRRPRSEVADSLSLP
jgi:hypothetical protein